MRKKNTTITIDDNSKLEIKKVLEKQKQERYSSVSHFVREAINYFIKLQNKVDSDKK